jgi:hypothetical protein
MGAGAWVVAAVPGWHPWRMGRDDMRASDADRQQTADRLRAALDEGRLDLSEYDDRLQRTYAAKTYAELKDVVADLPGAGQVPAATPAGSPDIYAGATQRWLWSLWDNYFGVVALVVGIWFILALSSGGDGDFFWPAWVAGPWGLWLLWETITGLGSGEPRKWVEKKERRRLEQIAQRERKEQAAHDRAALTAEPAEPGEQLPLKPDRRRDRERDRRRDRPREV